MRNTPWICRVYVHAILTGILLLVLLGPACKKKSAEKPAEKKAIQAEEKAVPQKAKTGQGLIISCLPRDGQKIFSLQQSIFVSFSQPIKPEDFSFTVKPDPGGWAKLWRDDGKHVSLQHTNPFQPGKTVELELSVKSASQKLLVRFRAFGVDSLQLIEEDAKKGLLDLDTGWTYRLQALFEPELLPEKYQSPTPIRCGTPVMTEFMEVRDRLKPETLEKLQPYLVRPTDPTSVFSRRIAKSKKPAALQSQPTSGLLFAQDQRPSNILLPLGWCSKKYGSYTVWAPGFQAGCASAEAIAKAIDSYKIWERFSELMGKDPPSDGRDPGDNGGDGTLDIYIVPEAESFRNTREPGTYLCGLCCATQGGMITPSYIIINGTQGEEDLMDTIAHELFHSFQFAFDSHEDKWWKEASATWSEYFIEKTWYGLMESYNPQAFDSEPHLLKTLTLEGGQHEYAIYLFPLYLSMKYGNKIIADIWQYCTQAGALDAVDTALLSEGGGLAGGSPLDECFKKFALMNWDQFEDYQGKETYPVQIDTLMLHGAEEKVFMPEKKNPYIKEIELPPLSARYWRFYKKYEHPEDQNALTHFLFDLRKFKENKKLTVQALIFFIKDNKFKLEDWTSREERSFCVNRKDEDFSEIILVFGNADREKTLTPELDVYVNDMECDDCYAKITRRDYTENHSWGGNNHLTQIFEKEATIYVSFEPGIFSATPGQYAQVLNMPYGSTTYQGKSIKVLDFKARDFMERISSSGVERKEKKGDHAEIVMPSLPTLKISGPDNQPLQFKPYPILMVYFEAQTGKVKYALVPEVEIKFLWDGKEPASFNVRSLGQGESSQSVQVQGIGSVKKIYQVKSGDGVENFNGDGEYTWEQKSSGLSEYTKQTYRWQIYRKKSATK
jgi:hypothetical protein